MQKTLFALSAIALFTLAIPAAACTPPYGWQKEIRAANEVFVTTGSSFSDTITNLDEYTPLTSHDDGTCGVTTTYVRTDMLYFATAVSIITLVLLLPYLFRRMRR